MKLSTLILKEIAHRKGNFILSLAALVSALTVFVSAFTMGEASSRETTRLMRNLGLNLRVIPGATNMSRFFEQGFSDHTLPEDYARRLAEHEGFTSNHLTAYLIRPISWLETPALLTGIAPEICPGDKKNSPIIRAIDPGNLYAGYEIARTLDLKPGREVDLLGTRFTLIGCGAETGTEEDIRLQCHLHDAQTLLGLPGRISEIRAIDCLCREFAHQGPEESLARLRGELALALPDTRVVRLHAMARARRDQRALMDNYLYYLVLPLVGGACIIWLGVLAMLNVRDRREEIGILRALGYGHGKVAALFLGRALFLGFISALLGFAGGTALALLAGPEIFKVTAQSLAIDFHLLGFSLLAAPGIAGLAALIPSLIALKQDPAVTLRQE